MAHGMGNNLFSEDWELVGTIDPDVLTATTHDSDWIDMKLYDQLAFVVMAGTLGSSATFAAQVREALTSGGGTPQNISGKSITTLTQAGTDDSDKQAVINLRADDLDMDDGYRWAGIRVTVGTQSCDGAVVIFGKPRYSAPDNDLASVAEVVA